MTKDALVQGLRARDEAAVAALLERVWAPGCRLAARLCPGAAEDVTQDALVACLEGLKPGLEDDALVPYVLGVVRNQARMRARGASRRKAREARGGRELTRDPAQEAARSEAGRLLHQALDALEESLSTPLFLRYVEGLSLRETSQVLEIPEGTVASRVRRGLERLRQRLPESVVSGAVPLEALLAALVVAAPGAAPSASAVLRRLRAAPRTPPLPLRPAKALAAAAALTLLASLPLLLTRRRPPAPPRQGEPPPQRAEVTSPGTSPRDTPRPRAGAAPPPARDGAPMDDAPTDPARPVAPAPRDATQAVAPSAPRHLAVQARDERGAPVAQVALDVQVDGRPYRAPPTALDDLEAELSARLGKLTLFLSGQRDLDGLDLDDEADRAQAERELADVWERKAAVVAAQQRARERRPPAERMLREGVWWTDAEGRASIPLPADATEVTLHAEGPSHAELAPLQLQPGAAATPVLLVLERTAPLELHLVGVPAHTELQVVGLAHGQLGDDGTVELRLPAGRRRLEVVLADGRAGEVEVDLTPAARSVVRLDFSRPAVVVAGTVRDPDGAPVQGAFVRLPRWGGRLDDLPGDLGTYLRPAACTDAEGRFRLELGSPPQRLWVSAPFFSEAEVRWDPRHPEITLAPLGQVWVQLEDLAPPRELELELRDRDGLSHAAWTQVGGQARFPPLPVGRYTLRVRASGKVVLERPLDLEHGYQHLELQVP